MLVTSPSSFIVWTRICILPDLFPDLKLAEHRPVRPRHEDNGAGGAGGEDHVHSTFENMSGTSLELLKGEAYIIQVTPSANTVQPTLHWLPIWVFAMNKKISDHNLQPRAQTSTTSRPAKRLASANKIHTWLSPSIKPKRRIPALANTSLSSMMKFSNFVFKWPILEPNLAMPKEWMMLSSNED